MNIDGRLKLLCATALVFNLVQGSAHAQKWIGPPNQEGTLWRSGKVVLGSEPTETNATLEVSRPLTGSDELLFSVNSPFQGMVSKRFEVDGKRAYAGGARNNSTVLPADYDLAVHRSAAIGVVHMDERIPNGYRLVVGGNILAEEVRVKLIGEWSDYVFEPSYPLRSLTEVEAFIQANRHLPDIPSAAQVESAGVSLGRMQSTLLRKIEELTLYLIEQDKTIDALNQKLARLERNTD
jgi:hypothetical protein